MDEQELLGEQVRRWALEGRWIDRGRWKRVRNGTLEYYPTKREAEPAGQSLNETSIRSLAMAN
jgi:hypothetical protein